MIDFDRDLYCVGIEHFDLIKSITKPAWYRRLYNFIFRRDGIFDDSNVKEFGAVALQEMERLGIDVIVLVQKPENLTIVREIVAKTPLLINLQCQIVPQSLRVDWAAARGAQYLKSYEQLKQIINRLNDVVEED